MTEDKPLSMDFHSVGFIPRLPPHTKNSDGNRHRSFHVPACRTSAAALSAAVDSTKLIRKRPHSQAEPTKKKSSPQAPAALRKRGVWGERRLLSEKPPLPPESPLPSPHLSGREREGGGLSEERPPPRYLSILTFPRPLTCLRLRRRSLRRWRGRSSRCQWRGCS